MLQGVSYVQISGIGAYIRIQMPIRAPAGLPCTIEAIIRSGTDTPSSRPTGPFSPNVGEEKFCELRLLGILRSSLPASHAQVTPKIAHLSDTPVPIRKYARHVTDKGRRELSLPTLLTTPPEGRRSPYEAHHSVVDHHGPNPVGGKRGGSGGGDRLRRSAS